MAQYVFRSWARLIRLGRRLAFPALIAISVLISAANSPALWPADAASVDLATLIEWVNGQHGMDAVAAVSELAVERGGWGPAPGDEVVYEPGLPWWVRGSVLTADSLPPDCGIPIGGPLSTPAHCEPIDVEREQQVRFGRALFMNDCGTESPVPRPSLDDVLATYIEEMGHSWQEYFYETEGRGQGDRTRLTFWEDANRMIAGREYQVKAYVLSLTEYLPSLSAEERARLYADICAPDGYANPLGRVVPCDGPPPGWPNPSGWPVTAPSPDELDELCAARRF